MSESLYFIAVLPPPNIQEQITKTKLEVAEKFGSRHALRSPPHITLHMPFKWKEKRLRELFQMMELINTDLEPFEIQLMDYDFFEPRVVFIDVVKSKSLNKLQAQVVNLCRQELKLDNANYKNFPFHPHVTIGFRDLRKRMFYEAKKYYEKQSIHFSFLADQISLLKHNGKEWNVVDIN